MTNSSPWYRWPIEIDGLPNLIATRQEMEQNTNMFLGRVVRRCFAHDFQILSRFQLLSFPGVLCTILEIRLGIFLYDPVEVPRMSTVISPVMEVLVRFSHVSASPETEHHSQDSLVLR